VSKKHLVLALENIYIDNLYPIGERFLMFTNRPEIHGMSIVLLGDFNPKIFQPAWFAAEGLIRSVEAENAEIEIIHPEIVSFKLDWLIFRATRDRCSFATVQEPSFETMRDLCISTFEILTHTPINKMGLNNDTHFKMRTTDEWHSLGHKLAPKDLWKDTFLNPGLRSLTIEGRRDDNFKGYIRVKVEPSVRIDPGVYIQVNDHYETNTDTIGCGAIINILRTCWKNSKERAINIINKILEGI